MRPIILLLLAVALAGAQMFPSPGPNSPYAHAGVTPPSFTGGNCFSNSVTSPQTCSFVGGGPSAGDNVYCIMEDTNPSASSASYTLTDNAGVGNVYTPIPASSVYGDSRGFQGFSSHNISGSPTVWTLTPSAFSGLGAIILYCKAGTNGSASPNDANSGMSGIGQCCGPGISATVNTSQAGDLALAIGDSHGQPLTASGTWTAYPTVGSPTIAGAYNTLSSAGSQTPTFLTGASGAWSGFMVTFF